ncbi:MAG: fibronectin type III domain-containing protein [Candidatus Riflebacteria bacterium]|nr:fibronectin type III domain-containing protein [Candidatus Riflebacteria bacterium]
MTVVVWDLNLSSLVFGYEIFRSQLGTNNGFQFVAVVPQGLNSFTDGGLSNDTEYMYQVVPVTRELLEGRRTQSRALRVQDGDATVPKPPGHDPANGAVIAAQTASGIRLSFGRPTQNTDGSLIGGGFNDDLVGGGFVIYRGKAAQGSFMPVGVIENIGNEITFTFTDGNGTALDFYYVCAFDNSGNLSQPSDIVSVQNFVPAAPQNVDAFAGNSFGSVIVTWRLSAQAVDGYRVYRSEERDRGYREISGLLANTINTYTDTSLAIPGKTLYYKVAAEANGLLGSPSAPAAAVPGPDSGVFYLNAEDAAIVGISNIADFTQVNGGGIIREAFPAPFIGNGVLLIRPSSTAVSGVAFLTLEWKTEIDATGFVPQQIFRSYDVYLVSVRNSASGIFDMALDEPNTGSNSIGPELSLTGKDFFQQNFGFPPTPTIERLGSISFSDEGAGLPNPGVEETLRLGVRYQGFNPAIARGRGELIVDALILVRR